MVLHPYRITLDLNRETYLRVKTEALHQGISAATLIRNLIKQSGMFVEEAAGSVDDKKDTSQ